MERTPQINNIEVSNRIEKIERKKAMGACFRSIERKNVWKDKIIKYI
jgi:hypothetical protein